MSAYRVMASTDSRLTALAAEVGQQLLKRAVKVAVAESCTGGLLAATITSVPGSSGWFEYGVVTYSAQAKQVLLGLPVSAVSTQSVVSEPTACALASGVQKLADAEYGIGITGVAGPGGGSAHYPVGTVVIGWAAQDVQARTYHFSGDREAVRMQAVYVALQGLLMIIERAGIS